jgi:hypothetical protein
MTLFIIRGVITPQAKAGRPLFIIDPSKLNAMKPRE